MGTKPVAPPVCITVQQLAAQMGTKAQTLRDYASRPDDPLPVRYVLGKERSGFVIVPELEEWLKRNTCLYGERRGITNERRLG